MTRNYNEDNIVFAQFKIYLDAYKHHHDLYIKAITLYFTVFAMIVGYFYKDNAYADSRWILPIIVFVLSFAASSGSVLYYRWVVRMRFIVDEIADDLHLRRFPFTVTLETSIVFAFSSLAIGVLSLMYGFLNMNDATYAQTD
ncbi:MAG: hypothetical protein ACR2QH_09920 [Geminicoccaceae bacterium]